MTPDEILEEALRLLHSDFYSPAELRRIGRELIDIANSRVIKVVISVFPDMNKFHVDADPGDSFAALIKKTYPDYRKADSIEIHELDGPMIIRRPSLASPVVLTEGDSFEIQIDTLPPGELGDFY